MISKCFEFSKREAFERGQAKKCYLTERNQFQCVSDVSEQNVQLNIRGKMAIHQKNAGAEKNVLNPFSNIQRNLRLPEKNI